MRFLSMLVVTGVVCAGVSGAQTDVAPLGPGVTPLGDIGIYSVAYQSYGGEVVHMPPAWSGHFEDVSGVAYLPGEGVMDRESILIHSPWKFTPGRAWVAYPLQLPEVTPITLSFGIAMRPDVCAPNRSDGVTFSCSLQTPGDAEPRELMREHYRQGTWKEFSFDLSEWAGKQVTLSLQTEPGPKNNPGWDFSYFGSPQIVCGVAGDTDRDLVKRLTSTRAYKAVAKAGLATAQNDPSRGITPSNILPFRNRIAPDGDVFRFEYEGDDCRLVYVYRPETGTLDDFEVLLDDAKPFQPALGGGATAVAEGEDRPVRLQGGQPELVSLDADGKALDVTWQYPLGGDTVRIVWRFGIHGKALSVDARCDEPKLVSFSLGRVGNAPIRKSISVPYLYSSVVYLPQTNLYTNRMLDWTQSHSSACPQGEASYHAKTDGTRNPLVESGFVAVSPTVHEVLPNLPHPPSPYIELLAPRIMLDIWGHHKNTYQGDAENLRTLKDNGVDNIAIISHVWQRYGYDVKLPDHLPANPQFGGDEGMVEFGKAANECGYVWSLHENYIDLYPDAPSYDPAARVIREDGTPSPAWFNRGTGVQSYGLKCNRALGFAKQNAPEIHRRFKTNAAYLDVHTCVPPWHQLDHEANQPMAAMCLAKVKHDSELFQYMRDTHEGPLFGEGHNHFYWAGLCDGAEAQVRGGENHTPFLDFDLLKMHPQMVNHGMGYYERWYAQGYDTRWGHDAGSVESIDKYRAQEVAYGHAGFIGNAQTDNIQWVAKEHHMMTAVQRMVNLGKPLSILYEVDGELVTASVALAAGQRDRQRIEYDMGTTVWVNWSPEPWKVKGRTLPQWGFLMMGPMSMAEFTVKDGVYSDYAEDIDYAFLDARTSFNMPYLNRGKDIEPRLADFEYLGENRIRVTYEWVVNDTFDEDQNCFVHFLNENVPEVGQIVFQQDHGLPKPTSQWKPGDVIVDGPYEIEVPRDKYDAYDLTIGLFKGGRVTLKGHVASDTRILLARLELQRDGDTITDIKLGDLEKAAAKYSTPRTDFDAHMNPEGTWVERQHIATNGSIKVNTESSRLVVFPYPRDKAFDVALNPYRLAEPDKKPKSYKVHALAAMTQEDMGEVPFTVKGERVRFAVGLKGAGRYVVTWEE